MAAPIADVLVIEDNPGDLRLIRLLLAEGDPALHVITATNFADGRKILSEQKIGSVLLDLSLPDSQGIDTIIGIRDVAPEAAIVVLTGLSDDEVALKALQNGADDYLVKGTGDGPLLVRSLRYAQERVRAARALRHSEARARAVFENAAIGIVITNRTGSIVEVNDALAAMMGVSAEALTGRTVEDITQAEDFLQEKQFSRDLLARRRPNYRLEKRFCRKDGSQIWGRVTVSLLDAGHPGQEMFLALVEDISARRVMEEQLRLAAKVLESTAEGIMVTDANRKMVHVNPAFTRITGFLPEEVLGRDPSILKSDRHGQDFYRAMYEELEATGHWEGEIWNRHKNGETFAEWLTVSVVRNESGSVTNFVGIFTDITMRKQSEERLAFLANHDPLTSLPNRLLFHERLARALARAHRKRQWVALLFIDLDGFKDVNDTHGHAAGDILLQIVAERLTGCTRQGDTVARLAGDEFTIILEDFEDIADTDTVARKVLREIEAPILVRGIELKISASIGISAFPGPEDTVPGMLAAADGAMYVAKKSGRNTYRYADEALNARFHPQDQGSGS